jgi:outer membrane protein
MMKRFGTAVSLMALLASTTGPAAADTLREAMTKAYQTNPTLAGARAGQRANDENVPINRARGLPDVDLSGGYTENIKPASNSFTSPDRFIAGQANLSVPVYLGGSVRNSVKAAAARVRAGQDGLRGTESDVFTAVVAAYMDVIRDEAIVGLNQSQVRVLQTNLEATQDRFQVGDLTRTDIAQSEARLALAQSQLQSAEAQLISSRERYVQVVGNEPGVLAQPPQLPGLPESVDVAVTKALSDNPDLLGAQKSADAARIDVKTARASRLPQVRLFAQDSYQNFLNTLGSTTTANISQTQNAVSAGVQVAVPLYQGGGPSAQVRQAQARSGQAQEGVIEVERGVIAQTRSAYASWQASLGVIQSSEKAVAANRLSLEGVKAENSVGTRSILDILNAEQELLNSQVQLVSARRNAYVAGFALLAAMGDAEARDLGLDGGILYDPTVNYKRVKGKLFDWDDDPKPTPVSTRTVDTTPQNPSVSSQ